MINAIEITEQEFLQGKQRQKAEPDFFEISIQIKKIMETGLRKLKKSGYKNEHTDEEDDKELAQYLKDLRIQSDRISDKFVKGLGQMYKGVLVKGEISVREDGGVYPYRCQHRLDCKQVANHLVKHKDNVIENMGEEKGNIVFDILTKIFPDNDPYHGNNKLEVNTDMAQGEEDIVAFDIYDFERHYDEDEAKLRGRILKVCKLKFNHGRIEFEDGDGQSVNNEIIHKLCLERHQGVITRIREDIVNSLKNKKDELNEIEQFIDDKMGKYLIVAEF